MSRSLPPEILDLVVDHLHNEPAALKACCIVSKLWIPRARRNLFAEVNFGPFRSPFASWMKAFPDPSNSPAHYTRTLSIRGLQFVAAVGTDVGRWVRAFRSVVHLLVATLSWGESWGDDYRVSLVPFHGLSPTITSLHLHSVSVPPSEIFSLLCSFPLLENFASFAFGGVDEADEWTSPLTSPRLTGTLELCSMVEGIGPTTRQLLDLPNGLRFTKIAVLCFSVADFESTTELVLGCSDSLESLNITGHLQDPSTVVSLNLTAAAKLKRLAFQSTRSNMQWITTALQTVESRDLQHLTVQPPPNTFINETEEQVRRQWQDLDRMLVQFLASRSIRPKVMYEVGGGEKDLRGHAPSLLPELTKSGLIDLVECNLQPGSR